MKKIILMGAAMLFTTTPASAADTFCLVLGQAKFMSRKVTITVDYGDKTGFFQDTRVRDQATGRVAKFNSMVDALNHMSENGWAFVDAYAMTVGGQNVYHYLMKRAD